VIIVLLMLGLGGVAVWYASEYVLHPYANRASVVNALPVASSTPRAPAWEQDVLDYFDDAAQQAKGGNATGAEVQVDQAVAEMEQARVRSKAAPSDFFERASAKLDYILTAPPGSESGTRNSDPTGSPQEPQERPSDPLAARLFQHVTQARVELAALRSWQESAPADAELAVNVAEDAIQSRVSNNNASGSAAALANPATALSVSANSHLRLPAGHLDIEAPRNLSKGETLDAASLHANFLDASLMPDTSEILLPPESRQLSDNVHIGNLTIAGASQTLDGIHWRNVTFIETRLRYEDGPVDLQNVRFIHCTFGFPSDARAATLAKTIATGKTSLTIQ
jgi:hypothetical protein